MRIKLTKKEKALAFKAASSADKLVHVWSYMDEDRSNEKDFEAARKHTETLIAFGQMVKRKLQPECEDTPEPQPEETSPETVKTSNPTAESTDRNSGSGDGSVQETRDPGDVGANEVTSSKASRGFFQRLFHRA